MASPFVELDVEGRVVRVSNPDKIYFRKRRETKLDLVEYYRSVGDGIVRALRDRPTYLKRHPDGAESEPIYQKRVPEHRPELIETTGMPARTARRTAGASPGSGSETTRPSGRLATAWSMSVSMRSRL